MFHFNLLVLVMLLSGIDDSHSPDFRRKKGKIYITASGTQRGLLAAVRITKDCAPRAADAARHARARRNEAKREGGRKKQPMIWRISQLESAKSSMVQGKLPDLTCMYVTYTRT